MTDEETDVEMTDGDRTRMALRKAVRHLAKALDATTDAVMLLRPHMDTKPVALMRCETAKADLTEIREQLRSLSADLTAFEHDADTDLEDER